ncbi:alpha/beta hydrolase [Paenibacillus spiritus]|uniref:Alpha/beta hydrolase n=1 Tax=Paenibacillus spiritus TaxID=2496557 RepID=A0A5J5G2E1_9BACL|nr:alpha/beta hydrolase [Paenibacillus spiritus]KAA9000992.1 alpha/beta hydrolase [Paenibacillus spiritus]
MGVGLEYAPQRRRRGRKFREGIGRRIRGTFRRDTRLWRSALSGPWLLLFAAFGAVMAGIPTGLGRAADLLLAALAAAAVTLLAGGAAALLLSLAGLPAPRLFTGAMLSAAVALWTILHFSELAPEAAAAFALPLALGGGALGLAAALLLARRYRAGLALAAALLAGGLAAAAGLGLLPAALPGAMTADRDAAVIAPGAGEAAPPALAAPDPGQPGESAWRSFSYAAPGKRRGYEGAELASGSADAAAYIGDWPRLRRWYWGFDQHELPLNGRVWMPEGDGPAPLVLMLHGNHAMEDPSDAGYAYLGELLASRGYIAVSLDENFLNYSAWSGIPDNDFKVRAWLILKHLEQLASFSETPGNPFYGRIDYSRTALLGHSRGGQAVAMAADAGRWFAGDPALASAKRFRIGAVIALAPTDKPVDGLQASLDNVSYLTLQGARDADVNDFFGDRQYIRTFNAAGSGTFKASLYIEQANHSRFNTDWGAVDQALPTGLFLKRSEIMEAKEQRTIAKVYVSAFLETALRGSGDYVELFRDYRTGRNWLPASTAYFNRYQGEGFRTLADYEEDRNPATAAAGAVETSGLTVAEEQARDREGGEKGSYGAVLSLAAGGNLADGSGQDGGGQDDSEQDGSPGGLYRITLAAGAAERLELARASHLSFSMALLPAADGEQAAGTAASPEITVELTDADGAVARLPLADLMPPAPLPVTDFTVTPWLASRLDDGKFGSPSEAVYQTYRVPLTLLKDANPAFRPEETASVAFRMTGGSGRVMLDDIGFDGDSPALRLAVGTGAGAAGTAASSPIF